MSDLLRLYGPEEPVDAKGYPLPWSSCPDCNGTGWIDLDPAGASRDGCHTCWAGPGHIGGEGSIKDLVRELADHRCIRCGHPYVKGQNGNGEWSPCDAHCRHGGPISVGESLLPQPQKTAGSYAKSYLDRVAAQWRILTVHHLTGDKLDCRWWNLAALCQRCHLTIQGRVNMAQVYPYPHSEWFQPYAAGYYAATYLGEDLTREQTIERIDELLALEAA